MALSSNLSEFPLNAFLHWLSQRSGVLKFFEVLENDWIELHLHQGNLRGIVTVSGIVNHPVNIRGLLLDLHGLSQGRFEFQDLDEAALQGDLNIDLMHFFLKTVTHEDSLEMFRDQFPASDTQFKFNDSNPQVFQALESLDSETRDLWRVIMPRLRQYPSVEELARKTGLALPWVQLGLLRLQTAGVIQPVSVESQD
jgi:Domain of unknown function (DUF4388)